AGLYVVGDDCVSVMRLDIGIGVTGACVDYFALQIESWRRPDRTAGRTVHLSSGGVLLEGLRFILDSETLPDNLSGVSIESDDAAAKLAALVLVVASGGLLKGRDGHVDPVPVQNRRSCNA